MTTDIRKVVIVGTGQVGMSCAFALLNQAVCDELVLIGSDRRKAGGEAADLSCGAAFSGSRMRIRAGGFDDCRDADLVALCAGVCQNPGESRPSLLSRSYGVFREIVPAVAASGFDGLYLVAADPVDVMTQATLSLSGAAPARVIGTGTVPDTARLRYLLGEYGGVDPRSVHAYVLGEHGDAAFIPWSQAYLATLPVTALPACDPGRYRPSRLGAISEEVRLAAARIIEAKGAACYGIGMAMARITQAVLGDENSVLTVSTLLQGAYGQQGVCAGVPCVVGREGIRQVVPLPLTAAEQRQFARCCEAIRARCRLLPAILRL